MTEIFFGKIKGVFFIWPSRSEPVVLSSKTRYHSENNNRITTSCSVHKGYGHDGTILNDIFLFRMTITLPLPYLWEANVFFLLLVYLSYCADSD